MQQLRSGDLQLLNRNLKALSYAIYTNIALMQHILNILKYFSTLININIEWTFVRALFSLGQLHSNTLDLFLGNRVVSFNPNASKEIFIWKVLSQQDND